MRRRNLQIILVGAVLMIVGISVAFAAMSTALNITTNSVVQQTNTWNIGFVTGTVTGTPGGTTSTTGRSCGNATVTATSVSVAATNLSKPDDSCTYTLQIKNNGTIAGTLATITPQNPTGTNVTCGTSSGATMVCGNITYKLTTDSAGSTLLNTTSNATLNGGSTRTIYLVVKFTGTAPSSTAITQSGAKFTLTYNQA
jgi:uncharacterized protein (DUF2141 family)